ncbi:uncharacterized protein [Rutidosis leptorrhynchoides]|uniref:uncharacterized protein n=1 Tax=Rutidosis leptorrhynchoides TaxID=125765 RepID=UPI003A98D534
MDSTWMSKCRSTPEFEEGLDKFLERIFSRKETGSHIYCPCINCGNLKGVDRVEAKSHLLCDGFFEGYKIPTVLLEPDDTLMWDAEDYMEGLAECIFHMFEDEYEDDFDIPETKNHSSVPNINAEMFYKVLGDAKKEVYPGCKVSVLSFIVRLFHSKCVGKCNEKGFSMILDTMREAFPHASTPKSLYEVRNLIRELGLGFEKIDACPNDCMLYWKQNKDKIICDACQTSRYKQSSNNDSEEESTTQADNDGDYKARKVGAKVLRYFPLIPRLQRLFMSPKTSEYMRWHQESRTKDGLLRHPADSPAWKTFDLQNHEFAKEPHNVRLGLASDGFNPFGNMSVSHSNNIDVYMQPIIDELKELWDTGVNTYDASTKSNFLLRACLIWTISDFPAYANLSGWSTKDKKEKEKFCKVLKRVKVPDGYAANISRQLCSKVLKTIDLIRIEKDILKILCDLERLFPLSFFDVMIHLVVHLASEARLGGPVHYRWMYPIERYLGTLKSYMQNRSKPEGSIAEGYLAEECVSFCSLYLASDVETIHNKTSQNHDDGGDETVLPIFCMFGRPIGATNVVKFGHDTLAIAHSHVLFNCSEIDFLRTEHLSILRQEYQTKSKRYIERLHSREFQEWLTDYVDEDMAGDNRITNDITALANGPYVVVKKYKGYIIYGFRFHIKDVEKNRTTQ